MGKRTDFSCGLDLGSIDRRPDGVLVGVGWVQLQLYEINPVSGVCNALGNTPESIGAIAVAPTGQIFGMSNSQFSRPDGGGVAMRLHKLTATGASQSYVFLSGASTYVSSMAFGPNGELYGLGITSGGQWSIVRINTETGVNTIAFTMPVAPTLGDIDIDTSGVLRTVIGGMLYKFNINTGAQISSIRIPDYTIGNATAPIVFVP